MLLEEVDAGLEGDLRGAIPSGVDYATVRHVEEFSEYLTVRSGTLEPLSTGFDTGAMVTVWSGGGLGFAATSDLSVSGLRGAGERAKHWAEATAKVGLAVDPPRTDVVGSYRSPVEVSWDELPIDERIGLLQRQSELLGGDRIVDHFAALGRREVRSLLITSDGGRIEQRFSFAYPMLQATASDGSDSQTRTFGGHAYCGQGGPEVLARFGFGDAAARVSQEAELLLDAPNCPTAKMDMVLAPDQMILQIHESIGHPLELDRLLGDERNYAGTTFLSADMYGSFQYGSDLLNVTYDPTVSGQLASFAFDDDGTPAERRYLIKDGVLLRGIGGTISQRRSGLEGVATSRACSWNRPPIDRMSNINIEAGNSSFDDLIGSVENGIYLETNNSWSIDDSRNKFQFSTEIGRLITNGELGEIVRNPSYRGVSSNFWRNLSGVGDRDTVKVMGTPNCGKGELNQMIGTGHAAPACRFSDVEVFGAGE
ncbi:MAG: TldD/PmbA family protein [Acidimicrobiales bacterium]